VTSDSPRSPPAAPAVQADSSKAEAGGSENASEASPRTLNQPSAALPPWLWPPYLTTSAEARYSGFKTASALRKAKLEGRIVPVGRRGGNEAPVSADRATRKYTPSGAKLSSVENLLIDRDDVGLNHRPNEHQNVVSAASLHVRAGSPLDGDCDSVASRPEAVFDLVRKTLRAN
jgi:hypothetical protein